MVNVTFYNLIRSKYNVTDVQVQSGTIQHIIEEILTIYPHISKEDFKTCVVFRDGKPIHYHGFKTIIDDNEDIIITHFVGGG